MAERFESVIVGGLTYIVKPYIDAAETELFEQYGEYHTGVDLALPGSNQLRNPIYSNCPGVVLFVGQEGSSYTVAVSINEWACMQYKNLDSVNVEFADEVDYADELGKASGHVHVEYLTYQVSEFSVRLLGDEDMMYAQDPTDIVTDGYEDAMYFDVWEGEFEEDEDEDYDDGYDFEVPYSALAMLSGNGDEEAYGEGT